MSKKVFHDRNINLDTFVADVEAWLKNNNFIIQSNKDASSYIIQAKRSISGRAIVGVNVGFSILIKREPYGFSVELNTKVMTPENIRAIRGIGWYFTFTPISIRKGILLMACAIKFELEIWEFIKTWILNHSPNTDVETSYVVANKKGIKKNLRRLENAFKDVLLRFLEKICG